MRNSAIKLKISQLGFICYLKARNSIGAVILSTDVVNEAWYQLSTSSLSSRENGKEIHQILYDDKISNNVHQTLFNKGIYHII